MKNNNKIAPYLPIIVTATALLVALVYLKVLSIHYLSFWNSSAALHIMHLIACIPLVCVLLYTKKLKKRMVYVSAYFILFAIVTFLIVLSITYGKMMIAFSIYSIHMYGYMAIIACLMSSKITWIYLPIITIFWPIAISTNYYDRELRLYLPYMVIVLSLVLQIILAIIAEIYAEKHKINKWRNFIFGIASFTIVNFFAIGVMNLLGKPTWLYAFVLPLPYIITTLITMHFIKPRKVLAEKGEEVASDLSV